MTARAIVAKALALPLAAVPADAALASFEPWDSLGHVQILTEVESTLGRTLDTEEALRIVDLPSLQAVLGAAS